MQHLRVIRPARSTDEVREPLSAAPGATHVTVPVGAALRPPGDLVEADVTREAVDGVLVVARRAQARRHGLRPLSTG